MAYLGAGYTPVGRGYKHETKQYRGYTMKKFTDGSVSVHKGKRRLKGFGTGGYRKAKAWIDRK